MLKIVNGLALLVGLLCAFFLPQTNVQTDLTSYAIGFLVVVWMLVSATGKLGVILNKPGMRSHRLALQLLAVIFMVLIVAMVTDRYPVSHPNYSWWITPLATIFWFGWPVVDVINLIESKNANRLSTLDDYLPPRPGF